MTAKKKPVAKKKIVAHKLPDTMSALIRVALADLKQVEKLKKRFTIDMADWHVPYTIENSKGHEVQKCSVCFAGSVMAMTLKIPDNKDQCFREFDFKTSQKLSAIDSLRTGNLSDAVEYLKIKPKFPFEDVQMQNVDIVDYENNPALFKKQMAKLADNLEQAGY